MIEKLMVQQQVKSVWQHMVGVMCLNMTHRKQVKRVLPILFKKYSNAKAFLQGKSEDQEINLVACLTELMSQVKFK